MKAAWVVSLMLVLSGCASVFEVTEQYHICYYGDSKRELCEQAPVPEGDERVCVDLARDTVFPLRDCNKVVGHERVKFF